MLSMHDEMSRLFFVLDIPFSSERTVVMQFISPGIGDGTSTVAREFAMVAARQLNGNVLLLDLNIHGFSQYDDIKKDKSSRYGHLDIVTEHGVNLNSIWQCDEESLSSKRRQLPVDIFQLSVDNLHISYNRFLNEEGNADAKLRNDGVFWNSLKQKYKLVVVDSPPLASSFDGLVASRFVDSTLLVVSAEKTRRPVAKNLCNRIVESGGHVSGVVLNKRRMYIPHFLYKYI